MITLSLGPLALPVQPLLLIACAFAAMLIARWLTPAGTDAAGEPLPRTRVADALFQAVLVGLAAARLGHVALYADLYAAQPLSAIDIRDGGWHAPTGLVAGLALLAWRAWRQRDWWRPLGVATTVGVVAWAGIGHALQRHAPSELPALALTDLATGQAVQLRDAARGRPVVLNLWATWCGPCRVEMPALAASERTHPRVLFVFANQGEPADRVRRYLQAERLDLRHVWLDPRGQTAAAVASRGLPTTVIYDAQGRRVAAHLGVLNEAALAARLRPLQ